MTTPPLPYASLPVTARAIEISSRLRVGVYDCLYVAVAESVGCEFVTADDKLVKNLRAYFSFIIALSTLP